MAFAVNMFNTVCETEGAVLALREAGFWDTSVVSGSASKREVLVDDLVSRAIEPELSDVDKLNVGHRLPEVFLRALQEERYPPEAVDWFQTWLADGFNLVVVYVEADEVEEAAGILHQHGGIAYGTPRGRI